MEEGDKGCPMIRIGASGWMFLLVPAYPGSPRQKAVKRLCVCVCVVNGNIVHLNDVWAVQLNWFVPGLHGVGRGAAAVASSRDVTSGSAMWTHLPAPQQDPHRSCTSCCCQGLNCIGILNWEQTARNWGLMSDWPRCRPWPWHMTSWPDVQLGAVCQLLKYTQNKREEKTTK